MIQTTPALLALAQATALCVGSLIAIPAVAEVDPFDGNWRFSVTPYLWLPNVNGNLDYASRGLSTEIGPNDYLSNLQFALMLSGEAYRPRAWGDLPLVGTRQDSARIGTDT